MEPQATRDVACVYGLDHVKDESWKLISFAREEGL
jgi:hypothetical protein